jgi:serine-type D-Ala-D-Ala carboxypeptidase/endopeptidase (penicillin-binding protein 4)
MTADHLYIRRTSVPRRARLAWLALAALLAAVVMALAAACSRVEPPATPQEVQSVPEPGAAPAAGPDADKLTVRHPPPREETEAEPLLPAPAAPPASAIPLPPGAAPSEAPPSAPILTDDQLRVELGRWIRNGGVAVAVNGKTIFEYHPGTYVPASILKLATATAALNVLGPDYRFRTEVYVDAANNLYVRGYGEPYLVSEAWRAMGKSLEQLGVFDLPLNHLILDDSAFAPNQVADGAENSLNPYDARLGALVTNFNTINVTVVKRGKVLSAEPQTPITPLAFDLGKSLPRGTHRINLSRRPNNALRYSGEVARAIFTELGAHFSGSTQNKPVPAGLVPALVYRSEQPLREVIQAMLEFSSNFIANQVTIAMALEKNGPPARLADGVAITRQYLIEQEGLAADSFAMVEGSGISRRNHVDLDAMLRITDAFYPWRDLLRIHDAGQARLVLAKTGTLSDVHSLAGYLPAFGKDRRTFVIILNQKAHNREPVLQALLYRFGADVPETAWGQ